jgi:hypothetical protein
MEWVPTRPPNLRFAGPFSRAATTTCASTWWARRDPRPALDRALRAPRWPGTASRHRDRPRLRVDQHGRQGRAGGARQARLLHARRPAHGARRRAAASSPPATPAPPWPRPRWCWACWPASSAGAGDHPAHGHGQPVAAAGRGRQRRLRPRQPRPVRGDGPHVRAQRAADRQSRASACSRSAKKTPRATRSRDTLPLLRSCGDQLHRQRRRPRPLQRAHRRCGLRRLRRQRRAQDLRGHARSWSARCCARR